VCTEDDEHEIVVNDKTIGKSNQSEIQNPKSKISMIPLSYYLILSAILFLIGTAGVLTRRNAIIILMSIELMLNGANLTFVAFARHFGTVDGHIFVFLAITIAAAEAGIGLALVILLFRNRGTVNVDEMNVLKW
jgi:NADH-quinone oxidoreductase subunit K